MSIERIGLLFEKLPQLQGLSREIRRHLELQTILAETLPTELRPSATVVASGTGELILIADNGAVAAKLRQLAPRILKLFRGRGIEATGIRVQTQVSIRHKPLPRKPISLSNDARQALLELSSKLKDSPLRSAVEKLGQPDLVSSRSQHETLKNKQ
jgi:hypothetical protein